MTRAIVLALTVLVILALVAAGFGLSRVLPDHRVRATRMRLHLRRKPGRGYATLGELWLRWGRFASFRQSRRARPGLSFLARARNAAAHAIFIGRVQYRHRLWMSVQMHLAILGPPRAHKTGTLARIVNRYPGAVVSASTKPDVFTLTSGLRARHDCRSLTGAGMVLAVLLSAGLLAASWAAHLHVVTFSLAALVLVLSRLWSWWPDAMEARSIYIFNPQRIAGLASTIRWNPIKGCADETTAWRRAQAFCEAAQTKGTGDDPFWQNQASAQLRSLFCAADLLNGDLELVTYWILSGNTVQAERILTERGRITWAATVMQLRLSRAEKTADTIKMVLTSALGFMADPALAECALPDEDNGFDLGEFLASAGTLYLIGETRGESSPVAPLFAALVTEIHWAATQMGSTMRGNRLDPPLLLALDEVTQICPVPVPSLLADSGGRGIQMIIGCHGIAQLEQRWGKHGAQAIVDTANILLVPGVKNPDTLEAVSKLCGDMPYHERGGEKPSRHRIAPPEVIRELPAKFGFLIQGGFSPVIPRLAMGWRDPRYILARWLGRDVARVVPVPFRQRGEIIAAQEALAHGPDELPHGVRELADTEAEPATRVMPDPAEEPVPEPVPAHANGHSQNGHGGELPWNAA